MPTPEYADTRTVTLVLDESDWHALRELEPDTVSWLQSRIRERITTARAADDEGEPDGAHAPIPDWVLKMAGMDGEEE